MKYKAKRGRRRTCLGYGLYKCEGADHIMKLKNLALGLKYQLPIMRMLRNYLVIRNGWGLFSINSHVNQHTGNDKISYPTHERATKAAKQMSEKHGKHFSVYKCIFCDGFHIGKNNDNK